MDSRPTPVRRGRYRWPLTLVGLVLSVLLGVIIGVATATIDGLPPGLDLVAGLQGALLGLQIDLLVRAHLRESERTRQARLIEELEEVDWLADVVRDLVHSAERVESRHAGTPIAAASRQALVDCQKTLSDLERGRMTTDFDDNAWVFELTERTQRSLRATSVQDVDLQFWKSGAGRHYWKLHKEALQRGVRVERVFIYRDWTSELDEVAREQASAGVHVQRVALANVQPPLRKDLIVWDGTRGYESRLNSAGDPVENVFTVDREDVARLRAHLELVQAGAEEFPAETPPGAASASDSRSGNVHEGNGRPRADAPMRTPSSNDSRAPE